MTPPSTSAWFIATESFGPADGDAWTDYVEWSGLTQLQEVVSLDQLLCPTLLPETQDHFWPYVVSQDFLSRYFVDFAFLKEQVTAVKKKNLLGVFRNPERAPEAPAADFEFMGYDLIDPETSVSALTNCGGFPDVFDNSELSPVGLLPEFERAREVQKQLRAAYPKEAHANCNLWAIFRYLSFPL